MSANYVIDLDVKDRFVLNPFVQASLRNKKEEFGFGLLGTAVYYRTYSRQDPTTGAQERWADTVIRVVNGVFTIRKWHYLTNNIPWDEMHMQKVAGQMAHAIFDMKMLAPGRGLWAGGTEMIYQRGSAALNNCFAGDEAFLTEQYGMTRLADAVGADVRVLTHEGWKNATVKTFGQQRLFEFTFVPVVKGRRIRSNHTLVKKATADHRWPLVDGTITEALKVGDRVPSQTHTPDESSTDYARGFSHGLVFGDGTKQSSFTYRTRLCGDKTRLEKYFDDVTYPEHFNGDGYAIIHSKDDLKAFPSHKSPDYIAGFIAGWVTMDGTHESGDGKSVTLDTQHADGYRWLVENAPYAGLVVTGVNTDQRPTNYGERTLPLYRVRLRKSEDVSWEVASVVELGEDTVYCVVNRENERFTLSGGLYTLNCGYIEVRTLSEDAAWTMDMLMLGVGTGHNTQFFGDPHYTKPTDSFVRTYVIPDSREGWVESLRLLINSYEGHEKPRVDFDYSQVRPAGSPIKGFGGTASGPEPLIKLHERVRMFLDQYVEGKISGTRLVVDVMNAIGACVVAGNVRRSAEISLGDPTNDEFINLKNYEMFPDRQEWGWMSNNSVVIDSYSDLRELPKLADRVRDNGEPGIFNLLNIQKYGRYGEKKEDKATGANPCVTGDTRILTREGYKRIDSLVGVQVDVWNGQEWSEVTPSITGRNRDTLYVTLSNGARLHVTPNHEFVVQEDYRSVPYKKKAENLRVGEKLAKFNMPVVEGGRDMSSRGAYTAGFYVGDGTAGKRVLYLYGGKQDILPSLWYKSATAEPQHDRTRVVLHEDYSKNTVPFWLNVRGRLAWLAGLIDADGTVTKDRNIQITSIDQDFLNEVRVMLTTLGVQAQVTKNREAETRNMPNGYGGYSPYYCAATYRLLIPQTGAKQLADLGINEYLNMHSLEGFTDRDAARYVTVVAIEQGEVADTVYCFTEPKNNTGTFEGVVLGNCAEIPLEDGELCNLVEVFPTRCVDEHGRFSERVFRETLQLATFYASSVALLPTHSDRTNAVVERNRRIGVSLSGIADWMAEHATTDVIGWLDRGYKVVRNENERLAWEAGVPVSVRVTTVKPSGTISLLAGVSSGMHLPPFSRYLRRVRFGENSPIVPILQDAGVPYEKDVYSDNTLVFEFPVDMGKVRGQKDVSVWAKAQTVVLLTKFWSDNMVSNTLSFDPDREGDQIEDLLTMIVPFIKTISLLPLPDEGAVYVQSPIEPITRDEVRRRQKEIRDIDWNTFGGSDGADSKYCESDQCEL